MSDLDHELAHIHGLLEKKWANEGNASFSFVCSNGTQLPLTLHMMFQWALAIVSLSPCLVYILLTCNSKIVKQPYIIPPIPKLLILHCDILHCCHNVRHKLAPSAQPPSLHLSLQDPVTVLLSLVKS